MKLLQFFGSWMMTLASLIASVIGIVMSYSGISVITRDYPVGSKRLEFGFFLVAIAMGLLLVAWMFHPSIPKSTYNMMITVGCVIGILGLIGVAIGMSIIDGQMLAGSEIRRWQLFSAIAGFGAAVMPVIFLKKTSD